MSTHLVEPLCLPVQENNPQQNIPVDYLPLISTLSVPCQVRIGTVEMSIAELNQLKKGQVLQLKEQINEPVAILINNQIIARGELMNCDDFFAVLITELAP